MTPIVADTTGLLQRSDVTRLTKRIKRIKRRFPQLILQIVMHGFQPKYPFSMHAFWLFNAGNFAGNSRRGKDNHSLMIVVDPGRGEAAITLGYALEPLVPREGLDQLLAHAETAWRQARWADGLEELLEGLDALLESVAIPKAAPDSAAEHF